VVRLCRALALRRLRFSLAEIRSLLDDPQWDLASMAGRHAQETERRLAAAARLSTHLRSITREIIRTADASPDQLCAIMEELVGRYSKLPPLPKLGQTTRSRPQSVPAVRIHDARKRLGPDQVAQLVTDYQLGQPTTALMVTYGLGKGTVLNLLRAEGVPLRNQGICLQDLPEAIRLYEQGWSLLRVGEHFSCDGETVRKTLRTAGVVIRQPHEHRRS
jgi:hypothetical protein